MGANAASVRSMATRWATISTASAFALKVLAQRAIWFSSHPANRPAHQIRQRQPCGARLRVPLGTLRLAGRGSSPTRRVQRSSCAVAVGGVRGDTAPRQPLPGTREAWSQRVDGFPRA